MSPFASHRVGRKAKKKQVIPPAPGCEGATSRRRVVFSKALLTSMDLEHPNVNMSGSARLTAARSHQRRTKLRRTSSSSGVRRTRTFAELIRVGIVNHQVVMMQSCHAQRDVRRDTRWLMEEDDSCVHSRYTTAPPAIQLLMSNKMATARHAMWRLAIGATQLS